MPKTKNLLTTYLFVLPALILFLVFTIYPFYKVLQLSFFEWDGISSNMNFIWFQNFKNIIFHDETWWLSVRNAAYITFLVLILQNGLAFILAYIVDRGIKGKDFFRTVFFLPPVISGIVIGLIWNWVYNADYGLLNHALSLLGLEELRHAWLSEPKTALNSVSVIHMWRGFGWGFIILLAGLQGIPRELYEAAKIDGASEWQILQRITIPIMVPVFFIVSILSILGTMQIYDIIVATTGGGPGYHTEVPVTRILASMLGSSRFGYASAQGIIFGVILLIVSMVQLRISKKIKIQ